MTNNPIGHIKIYKETYPCKMIRMMTVANYVNKAVSTLVMVVYEQDYRGTTLSRGRLQYIGIRTMS